MKEQKGTMHEWVFYTKFEKTLNNQLGIGASSIKEKLMGVKYSCSFEWHRKEKVR